MKRLLLYSLICYALLACLGCASPQTLGMATLHAWAERPDGSIEHFKVEPKNFYYPDPQNSDVFYVISPSGIKVWYAHRPVYVLK